MCVMSYTKYGTVFRLVSHGGVFTLKNSKVRRLQIELWIKPNHPEMAKYSADIEKLSQYPMPIPITLFSFNWSITTETGF